MIRAALHVVHRESPVGHRRLHEAFLSDRRSRVQRAVFLLVVSTFVVACTETAPTVKAVGGRLVPTKGGAATFCGIAGEERRGLGCPASARLEGWLGPVSKADGTALIHMKLPPGLRSKPFVVTPLWAGEGMEEIVEGTPFLVRANREKVSRRWRPPAKLVERGPGWVQLRIQPISRGDESRTFDFAATEVPAGATLELAWGGADVGVDLPSVPSKLVVEVGDEGGEGFQPVATLQPQPGIAGQGWRIDEVDLGAFSGRSVSFRFRAELLGQKNEASPPLVLGIPRFMIREPRDGRPSIVLISLDTFRGDYLGRQYEGRSLTPVLDALAADGTQFDNAIAPNPTTTASHMSLFTALYPPTHGVWGPGPAMRLHPKVPLLTGVLAAEGYTTAAVTENAMLARGSGFGREFDFYREERGLGIWDTAGTIEQTFGVGMDWVSRHQDELFFLFLHTYQVHAPRSPLKRYESTFVKMPPGGGTYEEVESILYAGEVVHTDEWVGNLVEGLREMVPEQDLLIVIFSDHGEAFGEHEENGHGTALFDTTIRVPLIFWSPGRISPGHRITTPVSLVDVGPTLVELAGAQWPSPHQGRSLAPWMTGEPETGEVAPVWSVTHPAERLPQVGRVRHETALRLGDQKWVRRKPPHLDEVLSFEMKEDPEENEPGGRTSDPGGRIERWWVDQRAAADGIDEGREVVGLTEDVDPDLSLKLRALGYVD
jgi:arylsulfatase A-like enzyme